MATKLLIIEDDPILRRMYDIAFTEAGFEVSKAQDGTIVLETIQFNLPDIILMDLMMPNFNGLETLKELKGVSRTRHIPVLMLSAYDDEKLIQQALDLGAARYLIKNKYEPSQISAILREVLAEKEAHDKQ